MGENLVFDHIVIGVADLDAASGAMRERFGWEPMYGGVHPQGTANRVVRFADDSYVELLAAHDPDAPATQWLRDLTANGDRLLAWAVRTTDIDAVAQRLGIAPQPGSITTADGEVGHWQTLGGPGRGDRPFFIQYERDVRDVPDAAAAGIASVEVSGDKAKVESWLGDADLDVRVVEGEPRLLSVTVRGHDGQPIELRYD